MEKHKICKLIIQKIKQYLSSPDCLQAHREKNHFIRKRKLSMLHLVTYLFYTTKASMYQNLSAIRDDLFPSNFPEVSKQAVSKARQFINPTLFQDLFNLSVDVFYSNIRNRKLWHGYHVFAIDGSKIEVPNSQSNFDFFGEMFTYPHNDRKFSSGLASIVYDVLDDYIVHASLQKYIGSERAAAREHMKTLAALNIYENSVIVFDRGYYSDDMFRYCVSNGYLCLMRLRDKFKIVRSCHGDTIAVLPGNPKTGSEDIKIRIIEVILSDGSREYLGTNIFDKSISVDMFRELYFLRWPVECKYMELKEKFLLEEYSGKTKTAVFQEFYINLLMSNLTSLIKNKVDDDIDEHMTTTGKYRYQANRSYIIGRLKKAFPKILCDILQTEYIDHIVSDAFKVRSQIIPGRKFRRKTRKLVCRKHFPNRKPVT